MKNFDAINRKQLIFIVILSILFGLVLEHQIKIIGSILPEQRKLDQFKVSKTNKSHVGDYEPTQEDFTAIVQTLKQDVETAFKNNTYAVGGLLVRNHPQNYQQILIAQDRNRVIGKLQNISQFFLHDPLFHGQTQMIKWYWQNKKRLGLPQPQDLTIVTSLDPCIMCTGNILLSGFNVASIQMDQQGGINYRKQKDFWKDWQNINASPQIYKGLRDKFGYYIIQDEQGREQFFGQNVQAQFKKWTVDHKVFSFFDYQMDQSKNNVGQYSKNSFIANKDLKDISLLQPQSHTLHKLKKIFNLFGKVDKQDFNKLQNGQISQILYDKMASNNVNCMVMVDKFGNVYGLSQDQRTPNDNKIATPIFNFVYDYYETYWELITEASETQWEQSNDQPKWKNSDTYLTMPNPKDCIHIIRDIPKISQVQTMQFFGIFFNIANRNKNIISLAYLNGTPQDQSELKQFIATLPPLYRGVFDNNNFFRKVTPSN